jgi:ankyrin repeat protein
MPRCGDSKQVVRMVEALLKAKADPNVQDKDPEKDPEFASKSFEEREEHRTPLHYCAAFDYVHAAKLLLKAQADPNIVDGQYKTPLHLAIDEQASLDMVKTLLEGKADPDKGNMEIGLQSSYLMEAARTGDADLASALINAKANINIVGKQGMTPLHMAVRSRKGNVAKLLMDAGCDTSVKALGKTAAEMALPNNDAFIIKLLGAESKDAPKSSATLDQKTRKELYLE